MPGKISITIGTIQDISPARRRSVCAQQGQAKSLHLHAGRYLGPEDTKNTGNRRPNQQGPPEDQDCQPYAYAWPSYRLFFTSSICSSLTPSRPHTSCHGRLCCGLVLLGYIPSHLPACISLPVFVLSVYYYGSILHPSPASRRADCAGHGACQENNIHRFRFMIYLHCVRITQGLIYFWPQRARPFSSRSNTSSLQPTQGVCVLSE